jgi:transcriptional regulator with XRE-family HTH domain
MGGKMAAFVRRLRKERGLTQAQLAQLAGVSRDTILQIEKGSKEHGYSTIESVVSALGLKMNDVKDGDAKPPEPPPMSRETAHLLQIFETLETENRVLLLATAIRLHDLSIASAARAPAPEPTPDPQKKASRKH